VVGAASREPALVAPPAEEPAASDVAAEAPARRAVEAEPELEPANAEPELAHLVGRFLLPDGSPAPGVALAVRGWGANRERRLKYGEPDGWVDPEGATDADGRFDLAFDPPRAYQFVLDANLDGYAELSWRWSSLSPKEVTDVGEQTLAATGTVVGRIVRPDGSPVEGNWTVTGDSSYRPTGAGADETRVRTRAEPGTGAFRLENVPPGSLALETTNSRIGNRLDGPTVQVRAGEETEVELVYAGDDSRRIVVVTSCRPFHVFDPEPGAIRCTGGDGRVFEPQGSRSAQRYSFEDLDPGTYTIEVTSPMYLPWSRSGVRPGESVDALVRGSAAVTLAVRDAETGDEVLDYALDVRFEGASNVFRVREPGSEHPAGGLYDGLVPRDTTLIVVAPGYAPLEIHAGELAPNATRHVEGALVRGAAVHGIVQEAGAGPVSGAPVVLHPHLEGYDPADPRSWPQGSSERSAFEARSRHTETGADGGFVFEGVPEGDYDVRVTRDMLEAKAQNLHVVSGETVEVTLELPGTGAIAGRLKGPPDASFAGLQVVARPAEVALERVRSLGVQRRMKLPEAPVGGAGDYRLDRVAEGRATVYLALPSTTLPSSFSGPNVLPAAYLELGEVEVRAAADTRADFDLCERFPGAIALDVRVNGEPFPGGVVTAVQRTEGGGDTRAGGQLDVHGRRGRTSTPSSSTSERRARSP